MSSLDGFKKKRKYPFQFSSCLEWFKTYTAETDAIEPLGLFEFYGDIDLESDDPRTFALAYMMKSTHVGSITQSEWLSGLMRLRCDTKEKLKSSLPILQALLDDEDTFKKIYLYVFPFAKIKSESHLSVVATTFLIPILLSRRWPLASDFSDFLEQSNYKTITKDQWQGIYDFSIAINDDITKYNVDQVWPVLLDDFVDWLKATKPHLNQDNQNS